jgi:hypothetical protein
LSQHKPAHWLRKRQLKILATGKAWQVFAQTGPWSAVQMEKMVATIAKKMMGTKVTSFGSTLFVFLFIPFCTTQIY